MARTYRRKNETQEYSWVLRDWDSYWVHNDGIYNYVINIPFTYDPKSAQGKKELNRFHSDAGTHKCKEPGPAWYRNLTSQRPLRRQGKEQLRKYMLNEEFEVIIDENPPLPYWT